MDEFNFEDMIACFLLQEREDLVDELSVLIDQLKHLYEEDDEISDEDSEEEFDVGTTFDGFLYLK